MEKDFATLRQEEVDNNFEAFKEKLPEIIKEHKDEYALIKNKEILGYYKDFESALEYAEKTISDNIFSIQEVQDMEINLGFYSYAKF